MNFSSLILSLPSQNTTARMRAWRALKVAGAVMLRDGVYLLPEGDIQEDIFRAIATDVRTEGGMAYVVEMTEPDDSRFATLFDRKDDFAALMIETASLRSQMDIASKDEMSKKARKLRKAFDALVVIDFFPNEAGKQALSAVQDLERVLDPGEPHAADGEIRHLDIAAYQGRIWSTRKRPWVDRLASAWLIKRFIDPKARFLWLESSDQCSKDALGFDFDGAIFSHVGNRVTFETLSASFGLEPAALRRIGDLVHYLDVGGIAPIEASGVETILSGLRDTISDDDQLLATASLVFDGLFTAFTQGTTAS